MSSNTTITSSLKFISSSPFLEITASIPCGFCTSVIVSKTFSSTYKQSYFATSYNTSCDISSVFTQLSHTIILFI